MENTKPVGIEERFSSPMVPEKAVVKYIRQDTEDTFTLYIEPENSPFYFKPGQFNMLYVYGIGEVPISICGDPARTDTIAHTVKNVGRTTAALCNLKPGDELGFRGPYGTYWPASEIPGTDILFVAGGIGLPPLRPAIYQVMAERKKFGKVSLLYGARNPNELLYTDELEDWRELMDFESEVTVDEAHGGWSGHVGVVTELISEIGFRSRQPVAMICGPKIMIKFTVQELLSRNVPASSIYVSLERNMKCGVGLCGRCQMGPIFVCKDGPVFRYDRVQKWFEMEEA
ncbi:MAG: FAD/NAD(P)-binding protein [bacterium]